MTPGKEPQQKSVFKVVTLRNHHNVSNLSLVLQSFIWTNLNLIVSFVLACDPKLMPTFPQHRNIKSSKPTGSDTNTGAGDQTNNLPAISDLV